MSVESADDRTTMLADFGAAVSWTPAGGAPAGLTGLFDNATHLQSRYADDLPVVATEATLTIRASDLPAGAALDDAVSVGGVAYLVRSIMPDGTGLVAVHLEKDAS